jgi:hypothetical protein
MPMATPSGRFPPPLLLDLSLGAILFGGAAALAFHYGHIGFMPLDQSIVFDGGWRVVSGQVPFRDFTAPAGLTPLVLQAVFFRLAGVSWSTYVLHAAIVNGLFAAGVFLFLRLLPTPRAIAAACAGGSAFVLYPPVGTPYLEQHAFFFCFVALLLVTLAGRVTRRRAQQALLGLVPLALVLAFLSKPIPSVFYLPVVGALLGHAAVPPRRAIASLMAGALVTGLVLAGVAMVAGVDTGLLRTYLFDLPWREGQGRLAWVGATGGPAAALERARALCCPGTGSWRLTSAEMGWTLSAALVVWYAAAATRHVGRGWRYASLAVAGLAWLPVALFLRAFGARWLRQDGDLLMAAQFAATLGIVALAAIAILRAPNQEGMLRRLALAAASWGAVSVGALFAKLTYNHPAMGAGLSFVAVGMLAAALPPAPTRRSTLLIALLVFVVAVDAQRFHATINGPRAVHDPPFAYSDEPLPDGLRGLRWQTPAAYGLTPADLKALIAFFANDRHNFLLVGDTSILYGLTGRPSINPSLWFHDGLATPSPGSPAFDGYRRRLRTALARADVRYVVVEPAGTLMEVDSAALLEGLVLCRSVAVGRFTVREICDPGQVAH